MALSHGVPQVLLGMLYRLIGCGAPLQFYLGGCFLLFGLGMGAMFLLGSLLSGPAEPSRAWLLRGCAGGPLGGVLVITVLQCNWFEACRVWNAPVLRENFGVPFFMMQMCGWVSLLDKRPPHRPTATAAATALATAAVRASPANVFTVAEAADVGR